LRINPQHALQVERCISDLGAWATPMMIGREVSGRNGNERGLRGFLGRYFRASAVLVCAGFSGVVLLLCALAGVHFKSAVEDEFYRETGNISQVLMADFDDDAATADAILSGLAREIPQGEVTQSNEAELHRLLAGYALPPSMIGPAVLDRDGTLIASARSADVPNLSLKDRNTFRVHADTPGEAKLYISTPMRGPITNAWVIQFSRPLRDASGALYGVVLLSYRLSHFVGLYEKLKLSDGGLAGLVGKDGVVRIRSLNGVIGYGDAVSKMPLVYDRALAGETSGTFYSRGGPDGATRIGSFAVSPATPFYVTVGYDDGYLRAQYIGFFYVLGLCWLVLTAAMVAVAAFTHRAGKLSQQAQLEIINSALAERQKISADMHDSIGSSLAALLAYFGTANVDLADVKRRLGEILMELRFLVDSSEANDGDINLILGNVRHRLGGSIELAGLALQWRVGDLPRMKGLTARDALAIKLIVMEALSNVLHHARAKTATVTASYEPAAATIAVAIADDGIGFNSAAAGSGRGLANMQKRAASISTGAALAIDSAPGRGTTVRLDLKVPPARE
jgi:two-component sensor histidine kinase